MNEAKFIKAANLANSKFIRAKLRGADFSGTGNIYQTDFTDADLTGAIFTGASVTGTMTIKGAKASYQIKHIEDAQKKIAKGGGKKKK